MNFTRIEFLIALIKIIRDIYYQRIHQNERERERERGHKKHRTLI